MYEEAAAAFVQDAHEVLTAADCDGLDTNTEDPSLVVTAAAKAKAPAVHQPSASADMAGWLHIKGGKIGGWKRAYFLLHGATVTIYDDEASASSPDPSICKGYGTVTEAEAWPTSSRPPSVPDSSSDFW